MERAGSAVAVSGAALGAVAQLVVGWPWWTVAAAVVVAVWLLFLSSAFWRRTAGRPLATDVLLAVDPARGLRRERQAMVEAFRAAPFPLYGLPASWPGPRHLGGWGSRQSRGEPRVLTELTLAHGDPAAEHGPQLRVTVRVDLEGPGVPELRRVLAKDLWWMAGAGNEAPPAGTGGPPGPRARPTLGAGRHPGGRPPGGVRPAGRRGRAGAGRGRRGVPRG